MNTSASEQVQNRLPPPGDSLLSLINKQLELTQEVLENEGVIADELEASILKNDAQLSAKVDSYAWILDELDFRAEFMRQKAQALSAAARTFESKAEFLRERLRVSLLASNKPLMGDEVEFALGKPTVTYELNEGVSVDELPVDLCRIRRELSKTALNKIYESLSAEVKAKFYVKSKPRLLQRMRSPRRKQVKS